MSSSPLLQTDGGGPHLENLALCLASQIDAPTSQHIGASISGSPYKSFGTLGFYLKLGDGRVMGVTCRHVVQPPTALSKRFKMLKRPCRDHSVIQLCQGDYQSLTHKLRALVTATERQIQTHRETPGSNLHVQSLLLFLEELTVRQEALQRWASTESRVIGSVLYAPPLEYNATSDIANPLLHDWALITMRYQEQGNGLAHPLNRVYTGSFAVADRSTLSPRDQLLAIKSELGITEPIENIFDGLDSLALSGVVRLDDASADTNSDFADDRVRPVRGAIRLVVGKFGRTTGLTFGIIRPVPSTDGNPGSSGRGADKVCRWAVVGPQPEGVVSPTRLPFSKKGDSGSCVWTLDGRIFGLLTSGLGEQIVPTYRPDITYVTPICKLLEDIRAHGFDVLDP